MPPDRLAKQKAEIDKAREEIEKIKLENTLLNSM